MQRRGLISNVGLWPTAILNQHFQSTLLGGGEGVTKKSTLCTLVKMMTIMDDPLLAVSSFSSCRCTLFLMARYTVIGGVRPCWYIAIGEVTYARTNCFTSNTFSLCKHIWKEGNQRWRTLAKEVCKNGSSYRPNQRWRTLAKEVCKNGSSYRPNQSPCAFVWCGP